MKRTLALALAAATLAGLVALPAAPAAAAGRSTTTAAQGLRAARYALAQRGDRYVYGATGPSRWDCSGLVKGAWRYAGKWIPRTTYQQVHIGAWVSRRNLRPGDLVFPSRHHVMIYVGGGYVVEAANPSTGVVKRRLGYYWTARRP